MNNKIRVVSVAIVVTLLCSYSVAQNTSVYEGDVLTLFLGKGAASQELKDLKSNFKCEMANETHYLSNSGIELILRSGVLSEIHIYSGSAVYGNFTGKLPNNLKFGMYSSDIKRLLGKPVVSYNNGYIEYELANYTLSCWFESGKLNQIGIAQKGSL
ncbi:MAG: hypothetical protein IPH78_02565 [Bacteroidetes bacterium]|nr:hypothetical protein [Bacteroidota bacterium]MBK8658035.1 hypothetical protein [Bacteroidota bacterium]